MLLMKAENPQATLDNTCQQKFSPAQMNTSAERSSLPWLLVRTERVLFKWEVLLLVNNIILFFQAPAILIALGIFWEMSLYIT